MRESIGGTWLISIVITFIALFAAFLAYAISYTKAFNAKNYIINLIERSEGWTSSPNSDDPYIHMSRNDLKDYNDAPAGGTNSVELEAFRYVKDLGYNVEALNTLNCAGVAGHHDHTSFGGAMHGGYCVTMYCPDKQGGNGQPITGTDSKVYYKVTTFITLEFLNATVTIPVSGETRTLFHDHGDQNLKNACIKN